MKKPKFNNLNSTNFSISSIIRGTLNSKTQGKKKIEGLVEILFHAINFFVHYFFIYLLLIYKLNIVGPIRLPTWVRVKYFIFYFLFLCGWLTLKWSPCTTLEFCSFR